MNHPQRELSADEIALVDGLVRPAKDQGVALTGPNGLLKALTKTVIEAGLDEEMAEHSGYGKQVGAGRNLVNWRNGKRAKTLLTDASGEVLIQVPRDREGSAHRDFNQQRVTAPTETAAIRVTIAWKVETGPREIRQPFSSAVTATGEVATNRRPSRLAFRQVRAPDRICMSTPVRVCTYTNFTRARAFHNGNRLRRLCRSTRATRIQSPTHLTGRAFRDGRRTDTGHKASSMVRLGKLVAGETQWCRSDTPRARLERHFWFLKTAPRREASQTLGQ